MDLGLPATGLTAIFGPSGSGKTTFLRAIAGLDHHKGGLVMVGDTVWQDSLHFVPTHERSLGYVFQEPSLFGHLSVSDNLEYGVKRRQTDAMPADLKPTIELLGIGHLLHRMPETLSGGERQRVAIARALASNPKILLMDEPLASLDQARKQDILPFLESIHTNLNIPILYISHSIDEVMRLADYLVLIEHGRIAGSGHVEEILTKLDHSLATDKDAASLVETVVAEHDPVYQLSYLDFPGGRVSVPIIDAAIGSRIRIRILARDVSLTLAHQQDTSILNIFEAKIDQIKETGGSQVIVRVLVGGIPLLAHITSKSLSVLDLDVGTRVYIQAKSIAIVS